MANLILDERDQSFVLYEMLDVEKLCEAELYSDFSKDIFDMSLATAAKLSTEELFPVFSEADKVGCRLEDGQVYVPECFKKVYKLYCENGFNCQAFPAAHGGQGMPLTVRTACQDWFLHNFSFVGYPGLGEGAAHLVATYGTHEQQEKYLPNMLAGEWGGSMALTEPGAGSDVGALSTKAIRQPDGSYKIQGTKIFITCGDSDLVSNIIHPVLARIEGDPEGTKGISIFLVPKYLVNDDGSLGRRNDYEIAKIEEKMGIHGSSTCLMNFGDNGDCYAELLGGERDGMKVMFQLMNEARLSVGMQGLGTASMAYLHAVKYAKERVQGTALKDMNKENPPRCTIINHPDVRRMLLWMKSNVDGIRAMTYYTAYCLDKAVVGVDEAERDKYQGLAEMLTPIVKAYNSDIGFKITEVAMQVYGGYGFCSEYPIEQLMRDIKIGSIYEGANGIQALDLVGRKMGMKKGAYFMAMLGEMNATVAKYKDVVPEIAADVQAAVNLLAEMGMFLGGCGKAGKFLVPIGHAFPFMMLFSYTVIAWMLLWEAGVAKSALDAKGVDLKDKAAVKGNADAAFYAGKLASAKYFVKNVLPETEAIAKAIKSEDLTIMEIAEESFAS